MKKQDIVAEWRTKNIDELDRNLATWKSIRDDIDASDKDRIEAAKSIARQMGALSPDRVATAGQISRSDTPEKPRITETRQDELDDLLKHIN